MFFKFAVATFLNLRRRFCMQCSQRYVLQQQRQHGADGKVSVARTKLEQPFGILVLLRLPQGAAWRCCMVTAHAMDVTSCNKKRQFARRQQRIRHRDEDEDDTDRDSVERCSRCGLGRGGDCSSLRVLATTTTMRCV